MEKYVKNNMILLERKYAVNQIRELVTLLLQERGITVKSKNSIKVAYPGEDLNVDWVKEGFNYSDNTYRVVYEKSNKSYYTDLYINLIEQEHIYNKDTDSVYDLCEVDARVEEGSLLNGKPPIVSKISFDEIAPTHEEAMKGYYISRKKPSNLFTITGPYDKCKEELERILTKSLNDLAKEFNLIVSKYTGLTNELKCSEFKTDECKGLVYSTYIIEKDVIAFECDIIFKFIPLDTKEVTSIELMSINIEEYSIINWMCGSTYSPYVLEKQLNKYLLRNNR